MTEADSGKGTPQPEMPQRRSFLKQALTLVLGAIAGLAPIAVGLRAFLDPLRRKADKGGMVRVTALEALPADGTPRKFTVAADQMDAWNKFPHTPIGAVYLRRIDDQHVEALNVVCPHAGCFVDYIPARKEYLCPCHRSTFRLDGRIDDASSPSPRPMDSLTVELRNQTEIWVQFQNFIAGQKAKIPTA